MLPIRIQPFNDELLSSYLWRLAITNGTGLPEMLGSEGFKLDERRDYDYSRDLELEKMVEKLTNRSLSFKYLEPSIQVLPAVRDKESVWCRPLSGRRRAGPQFCSQCISDFPYLGPLSRLTCSMVCLKHSVFLTDSCSVCKKIVFLRYGGRLLASDRPSFSSFRVCGRCGANLCEQTQQAAAPAYCQLQSEIYRRLGLFHTSEKEKSVFFRTLVLFAIALIENDVASFRKLGYKAIPFNVESDPGILFSTLRSEVRAQLLYVALSLFLGRPVLNPLRLRYRPRWVPQLEYPIAHDFSTHVQRSRTQDAPEKNPGLINVSVFELVEIFQKIHERTRTCQAVSEALRVENASNNPKMPKDS